MRFCGESRGDTLHERAHLGWAERLKGRAEAVEATVVRRVLAIGAVLVASAGLSALPAAPTQASTSATTETVGSARERAKELRALLAETRTKVAASIERYEQAEDALGLAVNQSVALTRELEAARADHAGSEATARARIAALYKSGGGTALIASVMTSTDPQDLFARAANVSAIVRVDSSVSAVAGSTAGRLEALEQRARDNASEKVRLAGVLEAETAEVEQLFATQQAALAAADATVQRLVEEEQARARAEAARRLAAQALSFGGVDASGDHVDPYVGPAGACPVGPVHSFSDTWHAPRSGGRQHQGTDVFAPKGSDAYAVVDGVIDKISNGGLGGLALWLRGTNGDRYYYAHNDLNYVTVGQVVKAGQPIATVGNTGNAETTPPHIHFEAHPGGGAAANPFLWLASLCS